jgi:hypothetical protein
MLPQANPWKAEQEKKRKQAQEKEAARWYAVEEKLGHLYTFWANEESENTIMEAVEELMKAYDRWLD